jgi:hypothetical protein
MLTEVQKDSLDRIESAEEGYSSMEIPEPKTESTPEPEVLDEVTKEDADEEKK